jgi:F-type H+-transporting ATPase subunit delta
MRDATIARNYAEALFAIAQKAGDLPGWGRMINEVGAAVDGDRTLRIFLESPKIPAEKKKALFTRSYQDRAPRLFVRFLHALVNNGRQNLLPDVAQEYLAMVDEAEGRMHATVTVASEPDDALRGVVKQQLSRAFGKEVVAHFAVNPAIMGGIVVRAGDTVIDGSVRRRLATLKTAMS